MATKNDLIKFYNDFEKWLDKKNKEELEGNLVWSSATTLPKFIYWLEHGDFLDELWFYEE